MTAAEPKNLSMEELSPERQKMVGEHLGLVYHVAQKLHRTMSGGERVDFDELVSAGTIGLMAAVRDFDTSRGLAFSTFATPRIRGAILDELRRMDHVPRSLRRKSRDLSRAWEELTRVLGREPEAREIADHLGVDLPTIHRWQAEAEWTGRVSLSETGGSDGSSEQRVALEDRLALPDEQTIEDQINLSEEVELLRDALLDLKEQERVVLSLYYFEELKLHEIATVLNLTESRISQIRSKAISRLRVSLQSLREEAA